MLFQSKKTPFLVLSAVLLLVLALAGCGSKSNDSQEPSMLRRPIHPAARRRLTGARIY